MGTLDHKLRAIMKQRSLNQTQLGDMLGVTQATVSRWFKGSEPEGPTREAINNLFDELQKEAGVGGGDTVKLKGRVGAGAEIYAIDSGEWEDVEAPSDYTDSTVAVEVSGDSMYPAYEDGTLLYYSKLLPPEDMINKRCVVQLASEKIFVKILRKGSADGLWTLQSLNPLYPDMVDEVVEWAAHIDWIKPR